MKLPRESWENTLRKLGLQWKKKPMRPQHATRKQGLETLEPRHLMAAQVVGVGLVDDTGNNSLDRLTTDPRLTGFVVGNFSGGSVEVEFDHDDDGVREGMVSAALPGERWEYDPRTTDPALLTHTGALSVRYRAVEYDSAQQVVSTSAWNAFSLNMEASAPPEVDVKDSGNNSVPDGSGLVNFGSTTVGDPVLREFTIHNTGAGELRIATSGIRVSPGYEIVQWPSAVVAPSSQTTISVRLMAGAEGLFLGSLTIPTNDPDENPYNFQLNGQVTDDRPRLRVQTSAGSVIAHGGAIDAGTTTVGNAETLTITLVNTGEELLELDPNVIYLPGGFSVVTPFAQYVTPYGGQTSLTLSLDAADAGDYLGFLSFATNDPLLPNYTVMLSGIVDGSGWSEQEIAVQDVELNNDTGQSGTDRVTYDPRISGFVAGDFLGGSVELQFDHDGDGLVDGGLTINDSDREFSYDPRLTQPSLANYAGVFDLRYRAVLKDDQGEPVSVGLWDTLAVTLTLSPGAGNLRIFEFGLYSDTGEANDDRLTIDPTVYFAVQGDLEGGDALVEFDHDGDGTPESSIVVTETDAEFTYDPRVLEPLFATSIGEQTIHYRLHKRDASELVVASGGWDTFHFVSEAIPDSQWLVGDWGLVNDTDVEDDGISTDARVRGVATGPAAPATSSLELPRIFLQFDFHGDETPDSQIVVDSSGAFEIKPPLTAYGPTTLHSRVREWNDAFGVYLLGAWTEFNFTWKAPSGPQVDNLALVNDSGESDADKITLDARISGQLTGDRTAYARVYWDFDHDDIADGSTIAGSYGEFTAHLKQLAAGEQTVRFRSGAHDLVTGGELLGPWSSFVFTFETLPLPTVTNLALVTDDGESDTDGITTRGEFTGRLTGGAGDLSSREVEFDLNGDGVADASTFSGEAGRFSYDPQGLPTGATTVQARVRQWDDNLGAMVVGDWGSFSFTLLAETFYPAEFFELSLANDTGESESDQITTDATLVGVIRAGFAGRSGYLTLEFDHDGDGDVDGTTQTDSEGVFRYAPIGLAPGPHTLGGRVREWNYLASQVVIGEWSSFGFTLEAETNAAPGVTGLSLAADTGTSNSDGLTANGVITGMVENDRPAPTLIEIDITGDYVADDLVAAASDGTFVYEPPQGLLGAFVVHVRPVEWVERTGQFQFGSWSSLSFTFEQQADDPAVLVSFGVEESLEGTAADTNAPIVAGQISNEVKLSGVTIEADLDNDGVADRLTSTDTRGRFRLDLQSAPGLTDVELRTREILPNGQVQYGSWQSYQFTYVVATDAAPTIETLFLAVDDGPSDSDLSTTNPTLQGTVANDGSAAGLEVQFDHDGDDVVDGYATTGGDGAFTYTPASLPLGENTLRARVKERNAQGVAQAGVWSTITYTLVNPLSELVWIDQLGLASDTGAANDDGATDDGSVTGHVANAESGAVIEYDADGDGVADGETPVETDGSFVVNAAGLVAGLVTMRTRIRTADNQGGWTSVSYVLNDEPDGTEAQTLVAAFTNFSTLWQDARSDYQSVLTSSDLLYRQQTQSAQDAYDAALAAAEAARQASLASARAAFQTIEVQAEADRAAGIAAAGGQYATDLANFTGDPTSFQLREFAWPAGFEVSFSLPTDDEQAPPPLSGPIYSGADYDYLADPAYRAALASAEYQHNQTVQEAESAYQLSAASAETAYRQAVDAAQSQYGLAEEQAAALVEATWNASVNPIDIEEISAAVHRQTRSLEEGYARVQQRADEALGMQLQSQIEMHQNAAQSLNDSYTQAATALYEHYELIMSPLSPWDSQAYRDQAADLLTAHVTSLAEIYQVYQNTSTALSTSHWASSAGRAHELAVATHDLQLQLVDKLAEYAFHEQDRRIVADHAYAAPHAQAQKALQDAIAQAEHARGRTLAQAERDRGLAIQVAQINRWKAQATAVLAVTDARDAAEPSPWTTYQKELAQNAADYANAFAPDLITKATTDANAALTEANTAIDRHRDFALAANEAERVRVVADSDRYKEFQQDVNELREDREKAANLSNYNYAFAESNATRIQTHSSASSYQTYEADVQVAVKKSTIANGKVEADYAIRTTDPASHTQATREVTYELNLDYAALSFANVNRQLERTYDYEVAREQITANASFAANNAQSTEQVGVINADRDFQIDVATAAKNQSATVAAAYKTLLDGVAAAQETAAKAFAVSDKSLIDADASDQSAWNSADAASTDTFYVAAADDYVQTTSAWASAQSTPWSSYQLALANVEKGRITAVSQSLTTHDTQSGGAVSGLVTDLSSAFKSLDDQVAEALKSHDFTDAEDLKTYADSVAADKLAYQIDVLTKTAQHDADVAQRNAQHQNELSEEFRRHNVANHAATRDWHYITTDLSYHTQVALEAIYLAEGDPTPIEAQYSEDYAETVYDRDRIRLGLDRDHALNNSAFTRSLVEDLGVIHVALTSGTKESSDALAEELKGHSDDWTTSQAEATSTLGTSLATGQKTLRTTSAQDQAAFDDELAGYDGSLAQGLGQASDAAREGAVAQRGDYETDLYSEHADLTTNAPNQTGPLGDYQTMQRGVAQNDLAYSQGAATARNSHQSRLSLANQSHAAVINGPGGLQRTLVAAQGQADVQQIGLLANHDQTLSQTSTTNLGALAQDVQGAATTAARQGVIGETTFDVAVAQAHADYDADIALADEAHNNAYTLANYNYAHAIVGLEEIPQSLVDALNAANEDATNARDLAHKNADIALQTALGDAAIARANALGAALITEATDTASADVDYVTSENSGETTHETSVTSAYTPYVAASGIATRDFNLASTTAQAAYVAQQGESPVALAQDLKPLLTARAYAAANHEADFQIARSVRQAAAVASLAASYPPTSQIAFSAAEDAAHAQWFVLMKAPFAAYAEALASAAADEAIALAQASATSDNARQQANIAYATTNEPLNYQAKVDRNAAQRVEAEAEIARLSTWRLADANPRVPLGSSFATAAKNLAVANATADKAHWIADVSQLDSEALEAAHRDIRITRADGNVAFVTTRSTAETTWVTAITTGDDAYRQTRADGTKTLSTSLSLIERDRTIAAAGHQQTRAAAEAQATVNYWSAETTAANARLTAERTALADFRGADLAAQATAIAGIHTTLALPWTEYQSLLAVAKSQWWTTDGRSSLLAQTSAETTAASAYQSAVGPAFLTWSAAVALAEKNLTTSIATDAHAKRAGILTSDADYEKELSIADRVWQIAHSSAQGELSRAQAAGDRAFAPDFDEPSRAAITEPAVETNNTAHTTNRSAFFTSESLSASGQTSGKAVGRKNFIHAGNSGALAYISATSAADLAYQTIESSATEQRAIALATALSNRAVADADDLAAAIAQLAQASPSPWSVHDAAISLVNAEYQQALGPGMVAQITGIAQAQSTWEVAVASAARTAELAIFGAKYSFDNALASAEVDRVLAENAASLTASGVIPSAALQIAAKAAGNDAQSTASNATPTQSEVTGSAATQPDGGLTTADGGHQRPEKPLATPEVPERIKLLSVYGLRQGDTNGHLRPLLSEPTSDSQQAYSNSLTDYREQLLNALRGRPDVEFADRATPHAYDSLLRSGTRAPIVLAETPPLDDSPKTFQDVIDRLAAEWDKPREAIIDEFAMGVLEGFWDGLKDSAQLVWGTLYAAYSVNKYLNYTISPSGVLSRHASTYLFGYDPIAEESAYVEHINKVIGEYSASAVLNGVDLYSNFDQKAANAALNANLIAIKAKQIVDQIGKFLESQSNREQLAEAVMNGDWEKLDQLKQGLPKELQHVLDSVYAAGVSVSDVLAKQLTPRKLGYLTGQIIYEVAENYAIATAWSAATAATAGAAGASLPAIVAARAAKLSRTLHTTARKLGIDETVLKHALNAAQDGIWWALKHVEMCFVAGTPVHTSQGLVPIEEISTGDMVWSRPENDPTAAPRLNRVVRTIVTHPATLLHVTLESAAGATETLRGTGEHPFFVVDKNAFVAAKDLSLGDEFRLLDGSSAWVTAISRETAPAGKPFTTYNFTVENDHTYHVGQTGVWVHNTGSEICQQLGKKLQNHLKQFPSLSDEAVRNYLEKELREQLGDIADSEMAKHIDDVLSISPNSKFRGGKHGDTKYPKGDGIDSNHSPADAISPFRRNDGPAFQMDPGDHRRMSSTGSSREARDWRQKQQYLIAQGKLREAIQMDIDEARRLFGSKYDDAIQEMLDYIRSIGH